VIILAERYYFAFERKQIDRFNRVKLTNAKVSLPTLWLIEITRFSTFKID
jgi:hypothetical protein